MFIRGLHLVSTRHTIALDYTQQDVFKAKQMPLCQINLPNSKIRLHAKTGRGYMYCEPVIGGLAWEKFISGLHWAFLKNRTHVIVWPALSGFLSLYATQKCIALMAGIIMADWIKKWSNTECFPNVDPATEIGLRVISNGPTGASFWGLLIGFIFRFCRQQKHNTGIMHQLDYGTPGWLGRTKGSERTP